MPNVDEFDLVRGKKGKHYFAEPVAGCFPLLSDNSLSDEFHHCLTTHPLSIEIDCAAHHINNQGIHNDLVRYQTWHHCITTLEAFQTHLSCILNQRRWEIKSIANRLVNADAEEHILPLVATPYPIPVDSEPPPLPADVIPSPFVAMTPLAPSPRPLPVPNPADHLRGGYEPPTSTPAPSTPSPHPKNHPN